jgi:hypothetical protein
MVSARKLLKAIHRNCLECSGGIPSEVHECVMKECPLYPFRKGITGLYNTPGGKDKK